MQSPAQSVFMGWGLPGEKKVIGAYHEPDPLANPNSLPHSNCTPFGVHPYDSPDQEVVCI